jgi:response regulator RpfG family c-di-GMP phosphodiesterase
VVRVHGGPPQFDLKIATERRVASCEALASGGEMAETGRQMSSKFSNSRSNLYERLRRVLRRDTVWPEIWKGATIDLCAMVLDARSRVIASHCFRAAELAARLAQLLDLGEQDVDTVSTAGSLHDLGMIGVFDDVLNKPGSLTREEWVVMKRHPTTGADFLAPHPALAGVAPIVRHHHERWDGSGYPDGLKAEVVPMGARIVAVAESFDFITNKWLYRGDPLTALDAIRDISEHSGSWYDPAVVDALRALYR